MAIDYFQALSAPGGLGASLADLVRTVYENKAQERRASQAQATLSQSLFDKAIQRRDEAKSREAELVRKQEAQQQQALLDSQEAMRKRVMGLAQLLSGDPKALSRMPPEVANTVLSGTGMGMRPGRPRLGQFLANPFAPGDMQLVSQPESGIIPQSATSNAELPAADYGSMTFEQLQQKADEIRNRRIRTNK